MLGICVNNCAAVCCITSDGMHWHHVYIETRPLVAMTRLTPQAHARALRTARSAHSRFQSEPTADAATKPADHLYISHGVPPRRASHLGYLGCSERLWDRRRM